MERLANALKQRSGRATLFALELAIRFTTACVVVAMPLVLIAQLARLIR